MKVGDAGPVGAEGRGEPGWKTVHMYVGRPSTLGKRGELHSQFGVEWLVATLLGCKRRGFFVELAANDAIDDSNSLMLERDFAWDGLCVEPNTRYYYGHGHRKCTLVSAVVASRADEVITFAFRQGTLGGIVGPDFDNKRAFKKAIELPTATFEQVLKRADVPAFVDFLSLDVEGAEEAVMAGFPYGSYAFSVITVERPSDFLMGQLRSHGYHFLKYNHPADDQTWISERLRTFDLAMHNFTALLNGSCMAKLGYARPRYIQSRGDWAKQEEGRT